MGWLRAVVAAVVVTVGAGVAPAGAATFVVNATADAVDAAPGDGVCAAAGGACTLRAAVMEANAFPGADAITLPAGTFLLTLAGASEDAGATGDLDVAESLEVNGAGRDATAIDGLGADRIFHDLTGAALAVRDLALRRGAAAPAPGGAVLHVGNVPLLIERVAFGANTAAQGGAVFVQDGALTIADSVFTDNVADIGGAVLRVGTGAADIVRTEFTGSMANGGPGGGLIFVGSGALTITDSAFRDGFASAGAPDLYVSSTSGMTLGGSTFEGGVGAGVAGSLSYTGTGDVSIASSRFIGALGMSAGGACLVSTDGNLLITGSEFTDNVVLGTGGGLYFNSTMGGLTVRDTVFRGHIAAGGPGGAIYASAPGGLELTRVEVTDNSASAGAGGGVLAVSQASTTITDSRFVGNRVNGVGGGVYDAGAGPATVVGTTFADNVATGNPGGGYFRSGPGALVVGGSTFARNQATGVGGFGGALFNGSGAASSLVNVTFSDNVAGTAGGGLYLASETHVRHATFSGNRAGVPGAAIFNTNAASSVTASIFSAAAGGDHCDGAPLVANAGNIDSDGTCGLAGALVADPQLGPLADNGGPTETHLPLQTSPAIDGGASPACPPTDQRGIARPTDGNGDGTAACDAGATEFVDDCPTDPAKVEPGICGCGVPDTDANGNAVADCLLNAELHARVAQSRTLVEALTGERTPEQDAVKADLRAAAADLYAFVEQFTGTLTPPDPKRMKWAKKARRMLGATLRKRGRGLARAKTRAGKALDRLDGSVG